MLILIPLILILILIPLILILILIPLILILILATTSKQIILHALLATLTITRKQVSSNKAVATTATTWAAVLRLQPLIKQKLRTY